MIRRRKRLLREGQQQWWAYLNSGQFLTSVIAYAVDEARDKVCERLEDRNYHTELQQWMAEGEPIQNYKEW